MEYVIPIAGAKEPAGDKAVRFGRLIEAGIRVPDGFVIKTGAFRKFFEKNMLREKIFSDLLSIRNSETIILSADLPEDILEEVLPSYESLGISEKDSASLLTEASPSVAVRTSYPFTLDAKNPAFTEVKGKLSLIKAIKTAYATLFTINEERVAREILDKGVSLIIQRMLIPEKTGIAEPQDGYVVRCQRKGHDEVFIFDKDLRLVDRREEYSESRTEHDGLDDREAQAIATLLRRCEQAVGPAVIEWAVEKGELYVLNCIPASEEVIQETVSSSTAEDLLKSSESLFKDAMILCQEAISEHLATSPSDDPEIRDAALGHKTMDESLSIARRIIRGENKDNP